MDNTYATACNTYATAKDPSCSIAARWRGGALQTTTQGEGPHKNPDFNPNPTLALTLTQTPFQTLARTRTTAVESPAGDAPCSILF